MPAAAASAAPADPSLAVRVDDLLPQTQCRRCGFEGCRPYAEAVAGHAVPINRCPPGGDATIRALAGLLGTGVLPLDRTRGEPGPGRIARIGIAACIGCSKCIIACPVDAIVGAPKHQHHVLADRCTGCELCLPPCPTDCIVMTPLPSSRTVDDAARSRRHHQARQRRLATPPQGRSVPGAPPAPPAATAIVPGTAAAPLDPRDPLVALSAPEEKARRLAAIRARIRPSTGTPIR